MTDRPLTDLEFWGPAIEEAGVTFVFREDKVDGTDIASLDVQDAVKVAKFYHELGRKEGYPAQQAITEASDAMPEESYWSHNIDGAEEAEVVEFVKVMSDWYMVVMNAAEAVDFDPTLVYLQRFMFNPDTQEFTHVQENWWYTCSHCKGPMGWNASPTGGWFSHYAHPVDGHDAEL